MMTTRLDTRTWLVWGMGCMLPLLVSRNPWITLEVLTVVLVVRAVAIPRAHTRTGWFLRIAAVMALVGAGFNLLTVRAGDIVLFSMPDRWPIVGGVWTFNALLYGLVSGATLFVLVLTGISIANLINWMDLFHILPKRLAPIAVTGSVAWVFLPQTAVAWTHIRDTMAMRGQRVRSFRDFVPIVVPLLASGLERSLTMAEALETKGFSSPGARRVSGWRALAPVLLIAGLVGIATAAFQIAIGRTGEAVAIGAAGIGLIVLAGRAAPHAGPTITSYDVQRLHRPDAAVMGVSGFAIAVTIFWLVDRPDDLTLTFYPALEWPAPVPLLLLALSGLMLPAILLGREAVPS